MNQYPLDSCEIEEMMIFALFLWWQTDALFIIFYSDLL